MGSDPINAIIELVTNSDDAYGRRQRGRQAQIRIEVDRRSPRKIVVKDRAGGMSAAEMEERLGKVGGRTSGFETGGEARGLLGRGAKDTAHFGEAMWESSKDGARNRFILTSLGDWKIESMGSVSPRQSGTTVTLSIEPRFSVPMHATLVTKLRNHVALRPILMDPKGRDVRLCDLSQDREEKLRYEAPKGAKIQDGIVPIPGYEGEVLDFELFESDDVLTSAGEGREYWRHSFLITSGRAAYEVFGGGKFAQEPYASHLRSFFGYARVPGISDLIRQYDDRLAAQQDPEAHNPERIVRRDRSGLMASHPFVQAVYSLLEDTLRPHLERRRREAEEKAGGVSQSLRNRLDSVGRELADIMQESDSNMTGTEGALPPVGLSLIPSAVVVPPGEKARFTVRYRPSGSDDVDDLPSVTVIEGDEDGESVTGEMELVARTGYFSRSYVLDGRDEGSLCEISVALGGQTKTAVAEWKVRSPSPVEQLEFERATFGIKDGGRRGILLLAPWELVVEGSGSGLVEISGDPGISLSAPTFTMGFDEDRDAGACLIRVTGHGIGSRARIVANLDGEVAEAELRVVGSSVAGIKIDLRKESIDQRAWFVGESTLVVNANDRALARYLGPETAGRDWPGQDTVHFRTMLAEVIVWAAARQELQRQEASGSRSATSLFYDQADRMSRMLPRVHRALVPENELRGVRNW